MASKQFTDEFKAQILKEVKQIHSVSFVARKHNICNKNIYNWIKADAKKYKDPHLEENKKLKEELEESKLELMILKDLLKKTYQL